MKTWLFLLCVVALFSFSGCSSFQNIVGSADVYRYTSEEIINGDCYEERTLYDFGGNDVDLDEIQDFSYQSELVSHHPWRKDYNLELMPVFRNHFHMRPAHIYPQHPGLYENRLSEEEMTVLAVSTLEALGYEAEIVTRYYNAIWSKGFMAVSDDVRVGVEANGTMQVTFREGLMLPDGMTLPLWSNPYDPTNAAIKYLTERFAYTLGLAQTSFENSADDIVLRILDYHFNTISFFPVFTSEGTRFDMLGSIRRPLPIDITLSDKIGYFPIITPDEAIQRMLDGQGSFGVDMGQTRPTEDDIIDTHLVYFGHMLGRNQVEFFAPWYRFMVKTAGANHTQAYFVPAIVTEYLEDNPAWAFYPHQ